MVSLQNYTNVILSAAKESNFRRVVNAFTSVILSAVD